MGMKIAVTLALNLDPDPALYLPPLALSSKELRGSSKETWPNFRHLLLLTYSSTPPITLLTARTLPRSKSMSRSLVANPGHWPGSLGKMQEEFPGNRSSNLGNLGPFEYITFLLDSCFCKLPDYE